jgi:anaerobic magnesium-protoporphyrin IX monomethyl ester cyclase
LRLAFLDPVIRFSIPLGITGVASMLRRGGHEVMLFTVDRRVEKTINRIREYAPDAIGFSVLTGSHQACYAFARRLKQILPVPTLWGGPHPTFFPEMIELPWVDAVCLGEGEEAGLDFAGRFDREGGRLPTDVPNFWVKQDKVIFRNPVRPRNSRLDDLPFPARDLYAGQFPILRDHGIKHFIAHRGCPYRCSYCFNDAYNRMYRDQTGERFRYYSRSPENVVEEILWLRGKMPLKMVAFVDDIFTLDRQWTMDFAQIYGRRCRLPFSMNTRFDAVDGEMVGALAEAGLRLVYVGVESGDETIRRTVLLRTMTDETMCAAAGWFRRHGVKIIAENIIGSPGETFETTMRTLRFNMRIRPDVANASFFAPYPRLPLTARAVAEGCFDGDYERIRCNYYHDTVLTFANRRDRKRILNLRCFFTVLAHHPRLLFFLQPLLRCPPNAIFRWFGDLTDGYYLRKCVAYRMSFREFFRTLIHFLRSYR